MAIVIPTNKNKDEKLSLAIVSFFVLQDFNAMIKTVFPEQSFVPKCASLVVGLIIILIFYNNIYSLIRKNIVQRSYLLFFVIYLLTILFSVLRNEPFDVIISDSALWTFAFWIPIGVFAYFISDKEVLVEKFYKSSFFRSAFMLSIFFWFVFVGHDDDNKDYNMYFSYSLVVPLLLHLDQQLKKGSVPLLFLLLLEFSAIILYGSRGAFLCILSYFVFRLFLFSNSKQRFQNILYLLVGIAAFLAIVYYINIFENIGLHSRIIEKSESGEAFSGRDLIWLEGVYIIMENPLIGLGIGGEFYQMSVNSYNHIYSYLGYPLSISSTTPHNGFLELMLCFGIPIGLYVSFYIVGKIFLIRSIDSNSLKCFMIILYSSYIVPAFTVGDGIFVKPGIALFLYLALSIKRMNKINYIIKRDEFCKYQTKGTQQQLAGA